jgi:hypothetical protein
MFVDAPKEWNLLLFLDTGSLQISINVVFGVVMGWHFMAFLALFMEPEPPALAVLKVIFNAGIFRIYSAR